MMGYKLFLKKQHTPPLLILIRPPGVEEYEKRPWNFFLINKKNKTSNK
jgi:hypothetical protein